MLGAGDGVLGHVDCTLGMLNPVLRDLQPVAPRLATLLTKLVPAASDAIPTINGVEALVPSARRALLALPPVERKATAGGSVADLCARAGRPRSWLASDPTSPTSSPASSTASAGRPAMSYDANGEFVRVEPLVGLRASRDRGPRALSGGLTGAIPPLGGERHGLAGTVPGRRRPPAAGGGNPWLSPDIPASLGAICNPNDNQR